MSSLSLYVIEDALAQLLAAREDLLAEQPGLRDADERDQELAAVELALEDYVRQEVSKVDGIHSYLKYARITADVARQDAKEASTRAKRLEDSVDRVKRIAAAVMEQQGKKRLEGTGGRMLLLKGNGGVAPLTIQDDIVPDAYCSFDVRLTGQVWATIRQYLPVRSRDLFDKCSNRAPSQTLIRVALEAGEEVPGAHLEPRGVHLEVK